MASDMTFTVSEHYRLKKMANLAVEAVDLLDVGCAQLPNPFLENRNVVGVDIVPAELPSNYSRFVQGTLEELCGKDERFDAVVAGEIIEHLERPIDFLREIHCLLKPEGKVILSTPNPNSPIEGLLNLLLSKKYFYTKDHIMLFGQRWLIRMLEVSGFTNVKLYSGGFPIPPFGLVPCPRPWCYQTIAVASRPS